MVTIGNTATRIVLVQLIATLVLSATTLFLATLGLLHSSFTALALFFGGGICVLGNAWLAWVSCRPPLGSPPAKIVAAFYWGVLGKWMITAIAFLVIFKKLTEFRQVSSALILLAAFVLIQNLNWIYPALCRKAVRAKQP